ncbi:MAG: barstar family protein [Clostridia bacterium]|nr:barstar family protein [Clostridia bacterium]
MHTLLLDGRQYQSSSDVYAAIGRMLSLPAYFGMNADALNDCLSERRETVSLWILPGGSEEVRRCLSLIANVISDNGGTVKELG